MTKLYREEAIGSISAAQATWEANELAATLANRPEEKAEYETECGIPLKRVYTAADVADIPADALGFPGAYPFTRGPYPTMYRGRPWTIRQVAGFGNPEATNQRYKYMVQTGQTGLSTDFDLPTLLGLDSDDPMAFGEVGRCGVAIDTIDDVDRLFDGIDLEQISVSLTINPSAWVIYAMYVAVAESRGYDLTKLAGTLQADPLKEYVAQKEWIYPVRPAVRLLRDLIMYSAKVTPKLNPISLSGYPGDRLHHGLHHSLLRRSDCRRHGHRRLCATPLVLFHQPAGFLRTDLQVSRGETGLCEADG
jgi:methylmalonyl-CoA mutase N-terminal domain/subunit